MQVFSQSQKETVQPRGSKDLHTEKEDLGSTLKTCLGIPKDPLSIGTSGTGGCLKSYMFLQNQETLDCLAPGRDPSWEITEMALAVPSLWA